MLGPLSNLVKVWKKSLKEESFVFFIEAVALELEEVLLSEVRKSKVSLLGGLFIDKMQRQAKQCVIGLLDKKMLTRPIFKALKEVG